GGRIDTVDEASVASLRSIAGVSQTAADSTQSTTGSGGASSKRSSLLDREVFDTKRFREIAFDPIDHSRDLVDMAAPGCDLPDLRPTLRREQPENNLLLDQR